MGCHYSLLESNSSQGRAYTEVLEAKRKQYNYSSLIESQTKGGDFSTDNRKRRFVNTGWNSQDHLDALLPLPTSGVLSLGCPSSSSPSSSLFLGLATPHLASSLAASSLSALSMSRSVCAVPVVGLEGCAGTPEADIPARLLGDRTDAGREPESIVMSALHTGH